MTCSYWAIWTVAANNFAPIIVDCESVVGCSTWLTSRNRPKCFKVARKPPRLYPDDLLDRYDIFQIVKYALFYEQLCMTVSIHSKGSRKSTWERGRRGNKDISGFTSWTTVHLCVRWVRCAVHFMQLPRSASQCSLEAHWKPACLW